MFDGNGNWTSDFSAQADRDNGIKILASRFDNIFIADIKESFENCLTKDGQIAPIGNFNMGGQKITNVGNGTNANDAVNMSQFNNAVHKTGNENIAGEKTFTSSIISRDALALVCDDPNITKGTAPSTSKNTLIRFRDTNGANVGVLFHSYQTNKTSVVSMQAIKSNASSDTDYAQVSVNYPASGAPYATAPASDTNGSIVTTVNKSKSANGYFQLGNGLIINWGQAKSSTAEQTITFSKAFSSTNYFFSATWSQANNASAIFCTTSKTTTNCAITKLNYGGTSTGHESTYTWIAIGY